jgi:hypothetical protein
MITQNQKHLVNFEALADFTGNNPEFEKKLIEALQVDLNAFKAYVFQQPDEEQYLQFRKACHNIQPSLQMLQINDLIELIETYKSAYANKKESVSLIASKILELLDAVLLKAEQWSTS